MLQLILTILAIVLAILAIVPYALEIWYRYRGKPKLLVTIHSIEAKQNDSNSNVDLRFWLSIKLSKGYPAYFRNLHLILPFEANPYKHPHSSVTFQQIPSLDTSDLRTALVLYNPFLPNYSVTPKRHGFGYLIALVTPTTNHNVVFALFAEMEIDEARLDFWSIFYHARRYRKLLNMKVNLNQSTNQDFTG